MSTVKYTIFGIMISMYKILKIFIIFSENIDPHKRKRAVRSPYKVLR